MPTVDSSSPHELRRDVQPAGATADLHGHRAAVAAIASSHSTRPAIGPAPCGCAAYKRDHKSRRLQRRLDPVELQLVGDSSEQQARRYERSQSSRAAQHRCELPPPFLLHTTVRPRSTTVRPPRRRADPQPRSAASTTGGSRDRAGHPATRTNSAMNGDPYAQPVSVPVVSAARLEIIR